MKRALEPEVDTGQRRSRRSKVRQAEVEELMARMVDALRYPGEDALAVLVSIFQAVKAGRGRVKKGGGQHLLGDVAEALVAMVLALHRERGQHWFRVAGIGGQARWDIAIRWYEASEDAAFGRSGTAETTDAGRQRRAKAALQACKTVPWNLLEVSYPPPTQERGAYPGRGGRQRRGRRETDQDLLAR